MEKLKGELQKARDRIAELEGFKLAIEPRAAVDEGNVATVPIGGLQIAAGRSTRSSSRSQTITLAEVEKAVLASKEEEIKVQAIKQFDSYKANWEVNEKPKLLLSSAAAELERILKTINEPGSEKYFFSHPVEKDSGGTILGEILKILDAEMKRRVDSEFQKRVEEESEKKAKSRLQELVNVEWPKFVEDKITLREKELADLIAKNAITLLAKTWQL